VDDVSWIDMVISSEWINIIDLVNNVDINSTISQLLIVHMYAINMLRKDLIKEKNHNFEL
jgi:hypothetical protein